MFTDIVDSTSLVVALGDERWLTILRGHDVVVDASIRAHAGRVVNRAGDGVCAVFDDPDGALESALRIQRELARWRAATGLAVHVRIGIQWVDVLEAGRDLVGRGVHEAARISESATADEILASSAAVEAAGGSFPCDDVRIISLRGLPDPIPVVSIRAADGHGVCDNAALARL